MNIVDRVDSSLPHIRNREDFRTRVRRTAYAGELVSMRGERRSEPFYWLGQGSLPERHYPSLRQATYIVWSYDTPIAWWIPTPKEMETAAVEAWLDGTEMGYWVMPAVRYSVTTTQHQGLVTQALRDQNVRETDYRTVDHVKFEHVPSGCERSS